MLYKTKDHLPATLDSSMELPTKFGNFAGPGGGELTIFLLWAKFPSGQRGGATRRGVGHCSLLSTLCSLKKNGALPRFLFPNL